MAVRWHKTAQKGFSLLELLLAVAIGGLLLTYASFQIVSLSNIWLHRAYEDFFLEHVDGVTAFVNSSFNRAAAPKPPAFEGQQMDLERDNGDPDSENPDPQQPPQGDEGGKGGADTPPNGDVPEDSKEDLPTAATREPGVQLKRPPGARGIDEPLIYAYQDRPPPILMDAELPVSTGVDAWLYFERGRGLAILWYTSLLDEDTFRPEEALRSTLISPWVTEVLYVYYDPDTETWDEYDEVREMDGEYRLPDFLKLRFEYEDQEATRLIYIPQAQQSIPPF